MAKIASGDYVGIKVVNTEIYAPQTDFEHQLQKLRGLEKIKKNASEIKAPPDNKINLDGTFTIDNVHDLDGMTYIPTHGLTYSHDAASKMLFKAAPMNPDNPVYTIMVDTNEDHTQETDSRHYSWKCSSCWHKGTKCMSRKIPFRKCPNCDNTDPHTFSTSQINDRGNCKSIWQPNANNEVGSSLLNWKVARCNNCGYKNRYLIKQPKKCSECGNLL